MMNSDIRRRCEAIARLEQQRKELAAEIKELKATAKADGYDVSLITKTVSLMLKDADKQKKAIEQHELFDTYLNAVGLLSEPQDGNDDDKPAVHGEARIAKPLRATKPRPADASRPVESSGGWTVSADAPAAPYSQANASKVAPGNAGGTDVAVRHNNDRAGLSVGAAGGAEAPASIQILPPASPASPAVASEAAGDPTPPAADYSMPELPAFLDRRKHTVAA